MTASALPTIPDNLHGVDLAHVVSPSMAVRCRNRQIHTLGDVAHVFVLRRGLIAGINEVKLLAAVANWIDRNPAAAGQFPKPRPLPDAIPTSLLHVPVDVVFDQPNTITRAYHLNIFTLSDLENRHRHRSGSDGFRIELHYKKAREWAAANGDIPPNYGRASVEEEINWYMAKWPIEATIRGRVLCLDPRARPWCGSEKEHERARYWLDWIRSIVRSRGAEHSPISRAAAMLDQELKKTCSVTETAARALLETAGVHVGAVSAFVPLIVASDEFSRCARRGRNFRTRADGSVQFSTFGIQAVQDVERMLTQFCRREVFINRDDLRGVVPVRLMPLVDAALESFTALGDGFFAADRYRLRRFHNNAIRAALALGDVDVERFAARSANSLRPDRSFPSRQVPASVLRTLLTKHPQLRVDGNVFRYIGPPTELAQRDREVMALVQETHPLVVTTASRTLAARWGTKFASAYEYIRACPFVMIDRTSTADQVAAPQARVCLLTERIPPAVEVDDSSRERQQALKRLGHAILEASAK